MRPKCDVTAFAAWCAGADCLRLAAFAAATAASALPASSPLPLFFLEKCSEELDFLELDDETDGCGGSSVAAAAATAASATATSSVLSSSPRFDFLRKKWCEAAESPASVEKRTGERARRDDPGEWDRARVAARVAAVFGGGVMPRLDFLRPKCDVTACASSRPGVWTGGSCV